MSAADELETEDFRAPASATSSRSGASVWANSIQADPDWAPLDRTIDAFVAVAADTQLSFDFLTHPDGARAFDVLNDVPRSKGIIESTLQFIKSNLVVTQA